MIEAIAETDDALTLLYLEGEELNTEELKQALRRATIAASLCRCCVAPRSRQGRAAHARRGDRLSALAAGCSTDRRHAAGQVAGEEGVELITRPTDERTPFAGLVFKIVADPYVGKLAYFRVYSGKLEAGSYVLNSTRGQRERRRAADPDAREPREEIKEVDAGDIAAMVGPKQSYTGDTNL